MKYSRFSNKLDRHDEKKVSSMTACVYVNMCVSMRNRTRNEVNSSNMQSINYNDDTDYSTEETYVWSVFKLGFAE